VHAGVTREKTLGVSVWADPCEQLQKRPYGGMDDGEVNQRGHELKKKFKGGGKVLSSSVVRVKHTAKGKKR